MSDNSRLRSSRRFLRSSSKLPSCPSSLLPRIWIKTEAELLTISPQRLTQAAPADALTDPSFVALLFGVKSGSKLFWQLSSAFNDFVDAESGEIFRIEKIPGAPKHRTFALLRNNDPVPRVQTPQGKVLYVYRRDCPELRVEGGTVRCAGPPRESDIERWDFPLPSVDDFQRLHSRRSQKVTFV